MAVAEYHECIEEKKMAASWQSFNNLEQVVLRQKASLAVFKETLIFFSMKTELKNKHTT